MKVSILIPSRQRPMQLYSLINSIQEKTNTLDNIEVFVGVDKDDISFNSYQWVVRQFNLDIYLCRFRRTNRLQDYYNEMAKESTGSVLWVLNDDCLIKTKNWDNKLHSVVEIQHNYFTDIWYGDVWDSTRNYNNNGEYSCFPMLSRRAFETLGYFFKPEIKAWGTDKYLKHVFELSKIPGAIIPLRFIMIHHQHLQNDSTHKTLINRLASYAGQETRLDYAADAYKLRLALRK